VVDRSRDRQESETGYTYNMKVCVNYVSKLRKLRVHTRAHVFLSIVLVCVNREGSQSRLS